MENKKRTGAQDAAKGIMIIFVILFHCYLMTFEVPDDALGTFNIVIAIVPFLLSSFFFYTGYNYVPNKRTFKENVARRAKQLLIPLVFVFIIDVILLSSMELIFAHDNLAYTFKGIGNSILFGLMSQPTALLTGFPKDGNVLFSLVLGLGLLWFLYCLFICSIFFYLLVNFTNKKATNLISVVIALLAAAFCLGEFVGVYLPYTVQCYPVVLAIMLTAAHLRQYRFLNKRIHSKKESILHCTNVVVAEGLIVGISLACHYHFGAVLTGSIPGGLFDYSLRGFDAFIAYAFSIIGTYFIHTLCRLIKHVPYLGSGLQWIGNHSAIYYLLHPIFITLASIAFFQKRIMWGQAQALIFLVFTMAMLTLVCLLFDYIGKKKQIKLKMIEEIESSKDKEDDDDEPQLERA